MPAVVAALRSGKVHLAGLRVLAPHLTDINCELLLNEAAGKSKKEIEELAARIAPADPVPSSIKAIRPAAARIGADAQQTLSGAVRPSPEAMPSTAAAPAPATPVRTRPREVVAPLSGETFNVRFTATRELRDKLVEAQALLGHRVPDGDLAKIIESGVDLLIAKTKKEKFGVGRKVRMSSPASSNGSDEAAADTPAAAAALKSTPNGPKTPTRHIPEAIKRAVYERAGGQCTFEDERGRRCSSKRVLEFDHEDGLPGRGATTSRRSASSAARTINTRPTRCTDVSSWTAHAPERCGRTRSTRPGAS
jgi:hypothetical protein